MLGSPFKLTRAHTTAAATTTTTTTGEVAPEAKSTTTVGLPSSEGDDTAPAPAPASSTSEPVPSPASEEEGGEDVVSEEAAAVTETPETPSIGRGGDDDDEPLATTTTSDEGEPPEPPAEFPVVVAPDAAETTPSPSAEAFVAVEQKEGTSGPSAQPTQVQPSPTFASAFQEEAPPSFSSEPDVVKFNKPTSTKLSDMYQDAKIAELKPEEIVKVAEEARNAKTDATAEKEEEETEESAAAAAAANAEEEEEEEKVKDGTEEVSTEVKEKVVEAGVDTEDGGGIEVSSIDQKAVVEVCVTPEEQAVNALLEVRSKPKPKQKKSPNTKKKPTKQNVVIFVDFFFILQISLTFFWILCMPTT